MAAALVRSRRDVELFVQFGEPLCTIDAAVSRTVTAGTVCSEWVPLQNLHGGQRAAKALGQRLGPGVVVGLCYGIGTRRYTQAS
jgi:hypothetical protein